MGRLSKSHLQEPSGFHGHCIR
ncbi:hypothetical protein NC651_023912 [Populus alba x Populus x berolinensis]|nr:hypothetical protein NC651_023912 [Populus alba x Populus x berolinensis]